MTSPIPKLIWALAVGDYSLDPDKPDRFTAACAVNNGLRLHVAVDHLPNAPIRWVIFSREGKKLAQGRLCGGEGFETAQVMAEEAAEKLPRDRDAAPATGG